MYIFLLKYNACTFLINGTHVQPFYINCHRETEEGISTGGYVKKNKTLSINVIILFRR